MTLQNLLEMTKSAFSAFILFYLALSLASCIKTWECECKVYDANNGLVSSSSIPIEASSRSEAEGECDGWDEVIGDTTIVCGIIK